MTFLPPLDRLLWTVVILAHLGLIVRLWHQGLWRTYRLFFTYVIAHLLRCALLFSVPPNADLYGWIWFSTAPLVWLLSLLVVLELISLVLRDYRGISSLGRWVLTGSLIAAIAIALVSLGPDISGAPRFPIIHSFTVMHRAVASSLVLLLLFIGLFLAWYPVPLSRNVVVYFIGYCVYFLSDSMGYFLYNVIGHETYRVIKLTFLGFMAACSLFWVLYLTAAGEQRMIMLRRRTDPEDEQRLLHQLKAMNNALLRVARK